MALGLREGGAGELRGKDGGGGEATAAYRYAATDSFAYEDVPPPAQQMDRQPAVALGEEAGVLGDGRIPASVFERDTSEPGKDWSMMSTESVFGLQVAPSCDFTGYFLAHPELMDIATPPRDSSAAPADVPRPSAASGAPRQFDAIPELGNAAPSYSFAFPNLMEDKRYSSKKAQQSSEMPPTPKTAAPSGETSAPEAEASSKPEAEPEKEAPKGGMFSWMPCCS